MKTENHILHLTPCNHLLHHHLQWTYT